ncbi:hypothetical protein DFH08DRAFT_932279 [Mycena albidolilacea]|uniref:Uncharacterized protein n=1 Tax=Mycena albidolilacea TaxID=1033008 RepID=A0AAD7AFX5_9AGAR|nr:hypothetical protein DFH08DRAFT_932279 [Mycena albidolilacea]
MLEMGSSRTANALVWHCSKRSNTLNQLLHFRLDLLKQCSKDPYLAAQSKPFKGKVVRICFVLNPRSARHGRFCLAETLPTTAFLIVIASNSARQSSAPASNLAGQSSAPTSDSQQQQSSTNPSLPTSPAPTPPPASNTQQPSAPSRTSNSAAATAVVVIGGGSSTLGTGGIVGLAVAGGTALICLIGFVVWKLALADGENIKWPELNAHSDSGAGEDHALPVTQVKLFEAKFCFSTPKSAEILSFLRPNFGNFPNHPLVQLHGASQGARARLRQRRRRALHLPAQHGGIPRRRGRPVRGAAPPAQESGARGAVPRRPQRAAGRDPYRGPVPQTFNEGVHGAPPTDWDGEAITMIQMGRADPSPGPGVMYTGDGRTGSPAPGMYTDARTTSPGATGGIWWDVVLYAFLLATPSIYPPINSVLLSLQVCPTRTKKPRMFGTQADTATTHLRCEECVLGEYRHAHAAFDHSSCAELAGRNGWRENVALRCYTVAWNARPHSERDTAADEKREGGRRRRCTYAVAFAVVVSSMPNPGVSSYAYKSRLCILYSASCLNIIDIDAPALRLRFRSRRRSEMRWKGREGMKRGAPARLQPSPTARARRPHRPQSPRQPRAKRVHLASGLDRVAVAIPPRAAFRLPLENKSQSCVASHPQRRAPPLHARRNQNTYANRGYIALISIPPSIPAPYPSPNTSTFPPISLPPPILSPSTGAPSLIPSHHPTPLHPQRGRVGALLPCSPALASDSGARREIGVDWEGRALQEDGDWEGIGRTSWWVREVGIVGEVEKGDEREGREAEQTVGRFERVLALQRRRRVESSRGVVCSSRAGACLLGFGSEGMGTRIKWDGAEIASFVTARLLLDYLLCVASAFSFARPASRF